MLRHEVGATRALLRRPASLPAATCGRAFSHAVRSSLIRQAAPHALRCFSTASTNTLDTPFISDTIPLAEGILGTVEELMLEVGDSVVENEVIAVVETDKVALDVKASKAGVIEAVLVNIGDEVKEQQPIYALRA